MNTIPLIEGKVVKCITVFLLVLSLLTLVACSSIPGETREEQENTINTLVETTLADLYMQGPDIEAAIANSVGYVVASTKITKVPMVGAGAGYGVAIHTQSGEKTYLKMSRFDVGGGWGARSLRPVLIFQDQEKFDDFIDGVWEAQAGAEGSAKVGDSGAAGGAGTGDISDKGYSMYIITDVGVSATATAGVIRVSPVSLKK